MPSPEPAADSVSRRFPLIIIALAALLTGGCAGLPAGIPRAPADDATAAVMTLPGGRQVRVRQEALRFSGRARLRWPDGRTYDGQWHKGRPDGRGVETTADGSRYQGSFQDGEHHGQGRLESPDGSVYVGDFAHGRRDGTGTLTGSDGVYHGHWSGGLPHGEGTFESPDGARYQGQWYQGSRTGYGRYRAADGGGYEGDWVADQPDGFGRMTSPDGSSYDGGWRNGRRDGYGRAEGPPGLVYEGTWTDDRRQGFGREKRPDGSTYTGDWSRDQRHGKGLEVRPDGSFHDGQWEHNQPLGPGVRRNPTGIQTSGLWNGDNVSTGLVTLPTGAEYAGRLYAGPRRAAPGLVRWLHGAAGDGDPYAQLMLGTLYLDMEEPPPDVDRARRWLGPAALAGIAEAQFRLALTWENVNPPRVVELLAQAGGQAHALANETLGEYYYAGITVPRNLGTAIDYFQRAMAAGSVMARNNLAWLLATANEPARRDADRAVALIGPIALSSGHWQYLDTLAAALAAAGRYDEAVATARRALAAARQQGGGDTEALEQRLAGYRDGRAYVEPPP